MGQRKTAGFAATALAASVLVSGASAAQCVTEDGSAVDWWFLLKYPNAASTTCTGQCYSFIDSASLEWAESSKLVTDSDSLLGLQLADIYAGTSGLDYVMYNDQWPNGDWTENYGHSKGTFAYDSSGGWFMQHSIPDFPNYQADGYLYGNSQLKYGQYASCISYDVASFDTLAYALRFSGPWVFDTNLDAASTAGNMSELLSGNTFYQEQESVDLAVSSTGGQAIKLMAKTGAFGADMMDKVVSPNLGDIAMWSQSWLNSCTKVGSYCVSDSDYVVDVLESQYGDDTVEWPTYDDHAKWSISVLEGNWVCLMDNNRCTSQYTRGGNAQCFENAQLHTVLTTGTLQVDTCDDSNDDANDDAVALDDEVGCCHYDDATCNTGDVCCLSNCYDPSTCSYTESGCSGTYGAIHDCTWDDADGICVVGGSSNPLLLSKQGVVPVQAQQ